MTPPDADVKHVRQARLIAALKDPACFGGDVHRVSALETHISYVLLTGAFAYKVKKAVDFGFLDFTTLSSRRFYCEEELRLNRRLAPELYLTVVPIAGTIDAPRVGGAGPAIEYAVKMREFPQGALASRLLERGELGPQDIDALAATVAGFHANVERAAPGAGFGSPEGVYRAAADNFKALRSVVEDSEERQAIEALAAWTDREYEARRTIFLHRVEDGFVRECHGDLHLGNVARVDGALVIFDCIEFNSALRWIDVASEIAFAVMDLDYRKRPDLARRFLNAYLERTGDYGGLACLRFYLVYRALVRAKVARLRATQVGNEEARRAAISDYRGHLRLASAYAETPRPAILVTHGLSGSGKTTGSQALVERLGAVRVRSDVERKRLHGLEFARRDATAIERGLYGAEATEATYGRLADVARDIVGGGFTALLDAAFLKHRQRDRFRGIAHELAVPFVIVDFAANEATLRERVARRVAEGRDASDADLAVLEHQLETQEPLSEDEAGEVVRYDAQAAPGSASAAETWRVVGERIGTGASG